MVNKLQKFLISFLILANFTFLLAQDDNSHYKKKTFRIPASDFIKPGFKFTILGTSQASHTHLSSGKHFYNTYNLLNAFSGNNGFNNLNYENGELKSDNIVFNNIENFSNYNQPNSKTSPLGNLGISYTTPSGEWTFGLSVRGKEFKGDYYLNNNLPLEYFPGQIKYNWREIQYKVLRSHAIHKSIMIQPELGIREIQESYDRKSDVISFPIGQYYNTLQEKSRTFSHQAGISLYFKLIDDLQLKVTGKLFQPLSGNLQSHRNDIRNNDNSFYFRNLASKTNIVNMGGEEYETELSYGLDNFDFFIGYNLTRFTKETKSKNSEFPTIVTNGNYQEEIAQFYFIDEFLKSSYYDNQFNVRVPRNEELKYLYIGLSYHF
jgi:hypothetical protein